jgi:hypothetical protein
VFAVAPGRRFDFPAPRKRRHAAVVSLDARVGLLKNLQAFVDYSATISTNENIQGILGGLALRI